MIVERAEHPTWTSNAYLLADGDGGHGVLVDSNGVEEPLLEQVEARGMTITHVLVTHQHGDHVVRVQALARALRRPGRRERADARCRRADRRDDRGRRHVRSGGLEIRAIATPGHCRDHLALLVNGTDC